MKIKDKMETLNYKQFREQMDKETGELPLSKRRQLKGRTSIGAKEYQNAVSKEGDLQRQAEEYLKWKHIKYDRIPDKVYNYLFSKNNNIPDKDKIYMDSYLSGRPDLLVYKEFGDYLILGIWIELKSKTGRKRKKQRKFAEQTNVFEVRSFDKFIEIVDKFDSLRLG